ncbi:hypothetical protein Tco_0843472 [Tanacetum coccineum]|uniref:Uncharacterized protein n=1 Tax=Tanacetum coccineum TaxID=301880 RepID=A0ABQ5B2Q9_9ASTR
MTGPTPDPVTPVNQVIANGKNPNDSPSLQDQILDHFSSLKALIKQHNEKSGTGIEPIRLTFGNDEEVKARRGVVKEVGEKRDEDL